MNKRSVEISVGFFVLIGMLCVAYRTVKLGKMEILGAITIASRPVSPRLSGPEAGATVDMAGVEIGQVESIELDMQAYTALVTMKIRQEVV